MVFLCVNAKYLATFFAIFSVTKFARLNGALCSNRTTLKQNLINAYIIWTVVLCLNVQYMTGNDELT